MPQVGQIEMLKQYPVFLKDVSKDLRLTPDEQELAAGTRPDAWALWGIAALAGDELTPYPSQEDTARWGVPLLATEGEVLGKHVLDFRSGGLTLRVEEMYASKNPTIRSRFEHLSDRVAYWTF